MKDFRVHSLDAKYVGPFEHLYIEFKEKVIKDEAEVHIFTGENGTGKSTILYLLTCYTNWQLLKNRIQLKHYKEFSIETNYRFFESLGNGEVQITQSTFCELSKGAFTFQGFDYNNVVGKYFRNYQNFGYTGNDRDIHIKYDFAMFAYSGHRKIDNPKLESIKEISESPLEAALSFVNSSNPQLLLQWIANTKTKEALALKSKQEDEAKSYELSIIKLQKAISEIISSSLEFEMKSNPFDVFVKWNGDWLTFEVLPDGLKSIVSWLGDLLMRLDRIEWETEMDIFDRNFVLFLDEIDIHLHPAWQRKILPVVKKLFKNAQIFVSTHSPFVVGSVDGAWVYRLKKEGQYSVLDGEPMLSEDAKSYRLILEETFGIKQQFGETIERKLGEFYAMRKEILENKREISDEAFQDLVNELAPQSIEVESIVAMELRQLERIKKQKQLQPTL